MLSSISSIFISYINSLLTVDIVIISFAAFGTYAFMQLVFHFISGKRIFYK